jgi:hypothetical protein
LRGINCGAGGGTKPLKRDKHPASIDPEFLLLLDRGIRRVCLKNTFPKYSKPASLAIHSRIEFTFKIAAYDDRLSGNRENVTQRIVVQGSCALYQKTSIADHGK